jgi:hypothetical protein
MITREQFCLATGREPRQDDLERCNCPLVGQFGHWSCGWDHEANLPRFLLPLKWSPPPTDEEGV